MITFTLPPSTLDPVIFTLSASTVIFLALITLDLIAFSTILIFSIVYLTSPLVVSSRPNVSGEIPFFCISDTVFLIVSKLSSNFFLYSIALLYPVTGLRTYPNKLFLSSINFLTVPIIPKVFSLTLTSSLIPNSSRVFVTFALSTSFDIFTTFALISTLSLALTSEPFTLTLLPVIVTFSPLILEPSFLVSLVLVFSCLTL